MRRSRISPGGVWASYAGLVHGRATASIPAIFKNSTVTVFPKRLTNASVASSAVLRRSSSIASTIAVIETARCKTPRTSHIIARGIEDLRKDKPYQLEGSRRAAVS